MWDLPDEMYKEEELGDNLDGPVTQHTDDAPVIARTLAYGGSGSDQDLFLFFHDCLPNWKYPTAAIGM